MLIIVSVILAIVAVRLLFVQVVSAAGYAAFDKSQLVHKIPLVAQRGSILDSSGNVLAESIPQTTIYADPYEIKNPVQAAGELAPILQVSQSSLQNKLTQPTPFIYLARQVGDSTAAAVKKLGIYGIGFLSEPKRFYPLGQLGSPLLGGVELSGQGSGGIEYQFDRQLRGSQGEMVNQEAPDGTIIPGSNQVVKASRPGQNVYLTINSSIQYETEQSLASEIINSNALSGTAVVLDSHTGDILAMASLVAPGNPGYSTGTGSVAGLAPIGSSTNGNGQSSEIAPVEASENAATNSVFEPGSVMKIATFAGALQRNLITPSEVFSVPDTLNIAGYVFHDAEVHPVQEMSATDILAQSSNVGTITIASKLGASEITDYIKAFGFGEPTGLSFPGSSAGIVIPAEKWSGTAIGSVPIGQDSSVTELQIADAYNTIANGGVFVPPKLVKGFGEPNKGMVTEASSQKPRRVISPYVDSELVSMFQQVVQSGTGVEAVVPGYTVAGKTGTAQIPNPIAAGYLPGAYMATFAGFVPAQNPALTIVVTLDRPTPVYYGGSVAAPVFSEIARYALRQLDIPPTVQISSSGQPTVVGSLETTAATKSATVTPNSSSKASNSGVNGVTGTQTQYPSSGSATAAKN